MKHWQYSNGINENSCFKSSRCRKYRFSIGRKKGVHDLVQIAGAAMFFAPSKFRTKH